MEHTAWVEIEPKAKGNRQKIAHFGGKARIVNDAAVVKRERDLTALLLSCPPPSPFVGAVRLDVTFVMKIPKSWPQWKRAAAAAGVRFPYTEKKTRGGGIPDRGNLLKLLEDAVEAAGWLSNDSQICSGDVTKIYGPTPGYRLRLLSLDECLTRADWLARLTSEQGEQRSP